MEEAYQIDVYETVRGKLPYLEWECSLAARDRATITTRLVRIRQGNFGDCKPLKGVRGVYEFRIDFGPGYRIYYGMKGKKVILLLCGGDKRTQDRDILKAKAFWVDYLRSQSKEKGVR
jgi:putative addiction module killer protein